MENSFLVQIILIIIIFTLSIITVRWGFEDADIKIYLLMFAFMLLLFSLTSLLNDFWITFSLLILGYLIYTEIKK